MKMDALNWLIGELLWS